MAIMTQSQDVKKDLLDINTEKYYFDKLRPYMEEMMLKCKTDEILTRTIEKTINASDVFCNNKQYAELTDIVNNLLIGITDKSYFVTGPMRRGTEEEKNMVRDLITKLSDFLMIVKYEPEVSVEETKKRDRLDYSPNGENKGYLTHNMKELNKPNPKNRIPNI